MNFEHPLTFLVWLTSIVSVVLTYVVSYALIGELGDGTLWWKLSTIITCGTLAGAIIPEVVKVFTSVNSRHVREVVTSSREGGASLNIISGLVAGNFSAYWMGIVIVAPDGHRVGRVRRLGLQVLFPIAGSTVDASPVFAFGLVAFGFLGMGPVTIAVDSYGPVTDNAQSVYELSLIEDVPNIKAEMKRDFGFEPSLRQGQGVPRGERRRGQHLQGDGEAGADRHGGRRRHDDGVLDHLPADQRDDRRTSTSSR